MNPGNGVFETQSFIGMLLVGLVVGVLAKFFMPGRDPKGFIVTILLGMGGAMLAGFIGRSLGWYHYGQAPGWIASILGAMLILFIYRLIVGRAN